MKIVLILVISMYFVHATMADDQKYICKQTVDAADPPPVTAAPPAHAAGPPAGPPAGGRRRRALSSKDSERKCLVCLWQTAMPGPPAVPENQACLETKEKVVEWTANCFDAAAKKCWLCDWDRCNVNEATAKGKKPGEGSVGVSLLPKAWLGLIPVVVVLLTQMSALY